MEYVTKQQLKEMYFRPRLPRDPRYTHGTIDRMRLLQSIAGISLIFGALLLPCAAVAQSSADAGCGEVVTLETHDRTTTRYALAHPQAASQKGPRIALVLLAGGTGHLDLDGKGCPRALTGNSLVRSLPLFHEAGFTTALVDAPSNHFGGDGLGGFRIAVKHAEDIGKVIADLRTRTKGAVWIIGTSRGAISAVNAASRLSGASAPDGLVLTSALMSGFHGGRRAWTAHSVFDQPLEAIKVPVLVVGHEHDQCPRSPARMMPDITARTSGAREQVVTVTGGPGAGGASGLPRSGGGSRRGHSAFHTRRKVLKRGADGRNHQAAVQGDVFPPPPA
jgi:hypothetical protein